jgi:hypothetical protein
LREVICPVLELREEKRTFVKVGGGKVDFFQRRLLLRRALLGQKEKPKMIFNFLFFSRIYSRII